MSEEEWARIVEASKNVKRTPWFENRSRMLPGYACFLESGVEHNDYRFRRSVMIRIGHGVGHSHFDGLHLQIHAHGLPMTVDGVQRGGYSEPGDRNTRVHNTVEVNGKNWLGHSWVRALTDSEDAPYIRVRGAHSYAEKLFERQVALIDVDEGKGSSQNLTPEQMGPEPKGLPKGVVTPNSYVFDVFRVGGGSLHRYCFHATVNDPNGPQPQVKAKGWRRVGVSLRSSVVRSSGGWRHASSKFYFICRRSG